MFLLFAVAQVAAAACIVRGMLATDGVALSVLRALIDLLADARLADYAPALVVTTAITPLLPVAAGFGLRRRHL